MWSSKMAARWRRKDGLITAGDCDFGPRNNTCELILSKGVVENMDTMESSMDHSILAIFEDSAVASENKSAVEEESEALLSALTEMLDSVEDDDDQTLSPFDTLPDSTLLIHPECRDNSVTIPMKFEKKTEIKKLPQLFTKHSYSENRKVDNEVDVFTSTSLVNLVKLMHPYSLKLHVEEGEEVKKNHALFSLGEVWRYERPTEESDEEINVVSDDEAAVKETKEEDNGDEMRHNGKRLKSVLVNGSSSRAPPSREKKRVSFGPVQVASFDESVGLGLALTSGHTTEAVLVPRNITKALENLSGSALEPQILSSETNSKKAEVLSPKGETKAKSLSLQQYRQLRQKRQPLVEKQGNYTTKWPSVSELPKELPPILCLQGQRKNGYRPKTAQRNPDRNNSSITVDLQKPGCKTSSHLSSPSRPRPFEARPPTHLHDSGLNHQRTESRTLSPASPLPDTKSNANITLSGAKNSPVKKPAVFSSDPPNPVLLPLPVSQAASPSTEYSSSEPAVYRDSNPQSIRPLRETKAKRLTTPMPQVVLLNRDGAAQLQELKFNGTVSDISSRPLVQCPSTTLTGSECEELHPQPCKWSPMKETKLKPKTPQLTSTEQMKCPSSLHFAAQPSLHAPMQVKETLPDVPPSISPHEDSPPPLELIHGVQKEAGESGIEASDLTSLLEQFEETQAKQGRLCESELELNTISDSPPPKRQTCEDAHRNSCAALDDSTTLALDPLSASETLRNSPDPQMMEPVDIPEPLSTEVILSTRQEQSARRKNPPSKAIQIIDPRPLPSKRTHTSLPEPPAAYTSSHMHSLVSSDHDYCAPVDHTLTSATQRSRAKPSLLKDTSRAINESQVSSYVSGAAAECKIQSGQANPPVQRRSEPDIALQFSDCATMGNGASENKMAPCTLPTPPPSPPRRGMDKRRYQRSPRSGSSSHSSSSSSSPSSSSSSRSPKRQKVHRKRSDSSSCSSSRSRSVSRSPPRRNRSSYSRSIRSRSRSRSWSPSRSRSPSPPICCRRWRDVYSSRESRRLRREHEIRIQKLKAIDERRVVYVGRIRRAMTHNELRERFSQFGEVECVSLHFRDRGDHYAFVTFYNMKDAFAAIDNGSKLRQPDELPFDICFGGRRQFCNSNYADLDANRDADRSPAKSRSEDLDFDSLLKQAQRGLKR